MLLMVKSPVPLITLPYRHMEAQVDLTGLEAGSLRLHSVPKLPMKASPLLLFKARQQPYVANRFPMPLGLTEVILLLVTDTETMGRSLVRRFDVPHLPKNVMPELLPSAPIMVLVFEVPSPPMTASKLAVFTGAHLLLMTLTLRCPVQVCMTWPVARGNMQLDFIRNSSS